MTATVRVTFDVYWTGAPTLLPAFFATVAARLEPHGAGTRFPALAALAAGKVEPDQAGELGRELALIDDEIGELLIADVVSDDSRPEWIVDGRFTTIRGRDLVHMLMTAADTSQEAGEPMVVQRDFMKRI